ncbi:MAG TPA: hypothetical protein VK814_18770 [Acidobacteriaceae bacterium]|nr:hypothetical protein [Acidobacteriaceae bacterium]
MDGAMTGVVAAVTQPVLRGRRGASRGCRLGGVGGGEEGRLVAPPAAARRPSAER